MVLFEKCFIFLTQTFYSVCIAYIQKHAQKYTENVQLIELSQQSKHTHAFTNQNADLEIEHY